MPEADLLEAPSRVLIIEDSPTVRGHLKRCLQSEFPGAQISEASDGRSAFKELGQNSVQLIVSDLEMPGMDGLSFLLKLRANPVLKKKPVLVFSGSLSPEVGRLAAEDPLLRLLPKPSHPKDITRVLKELFTYSAAKPAAIQ